MSQQQPEPLVIDLLRHGEVAADGWAFRGSTDIALSERGWEQMRTTSTGFEHFDHIVSSPMQRCHLFARELCQQQQGELCILDDFREMDFGAWENKSFDELEQQYGELLQRFWHSPTGIQPPGGEHFESFTTRVIDCWQQWSSEDHGKHRLLVAHGGVIRVLLAHTLQMPMSALWRLHLPYASWSRISLCEGHQPRVIFINRLSL